MSHSPQITAPVRNMSIIRPVRWPHVSARFIPMREPVCMSMPRTRESRTSGKVMVCGGDVFCLDGECDKAQSGKSSDFGEAVSQLAALAAAGKDVAARRVRMSGLSRARRNSVVRPQPASVTAVRMVAGGRMWGWRSVTVKKRRWERQRTTTDGECWRVPFRKRYWCLPAEKAQLLPV